MSGPSLAELRGRVQKDRYREIGNWLARRVGRPSAVYGTWLAVRLGVSAHLVTLAALLASLGAAAAVASGTVLGFVSGAVLAHLAFWLDHVDGQVARWNRTDGLEGVYLDYMMHHAATLTLGYAFGHGLAARTGSLFWTALGFAAGLGWLGQSVQNDCRYKAFFQRLKRESGAFQVWGGAGGRPVPPAPWPRHGWSMLTWPAYKACEPHSVLIALTLLAASAMVVPWAWLRLWQGYLLGMAVLAPLLTVARVVRAVRNRAISAEFDRWFVVQHPART